MIHDAWQCKMIVLDPLHKLDSLLKLTNQALQSWSQRRVRNVRQQISLAKELLWRFDLVEEIRLLSPLERWLRCELKQKLLGLCSFERTIARQRYRLSWLREGDANTPYFHLHANHHRRRSYITHLKVELSRTLKWPKLFSSPFRKLTWHTSSQGALHGFGCL